MAAQQRIIPQENPFKGLDDLMWVIKNPDEYDAAQEKIREQTQLTDDARQNLAEAKAFMADYEEKKKEIEAAKNEIRAGCERFAQDADAWKGNVEAEKAILAACKTELDARAKAQEETADAQAQITKNIASQKKKLDDDYAEKLRLLEGREAAVSVDEQANKADADRLNELRLKLEAKLAKFQEMASM